jgi:segregation and condensation protein B
MDNENQTNFVEAEGNIEQNSEMNYENSVQADNSLPSDAQNHELNPEPSQKADPALLFAALDGLLLIHSKPVSVEKLANLLEVNEDEVKEIVDARKRAYEDDENSGLQIVVLEDKVQLATKARVSQFIQRLDGQKLVSLSMPALEALSVIAFKQPVTKAEIDAIRGVNCDGVISSLLEKKLIYVSGEKQVIGRPRLYSTTQDFLYYFGMKSLKELPLPSLEIPHQLTPEGQKEEKQKEQKQGEKEFDESQGLMPIVEEEASTEEEQNPSEPSSNNNSGD